MDLIWILTQIVRKQYLWDRILVTDWTFDNIRKYYFFFYYEYIILKSSYFGDTYWNTYGLNDVMSGICFKLIWQQTGGVTEETGLVWFDWHQGFTKLFCLILYMFKVFYGEKLKKNKQQNMFGVLLHIPSPRLFCSVGSGFSGTLFVLFTH